MFYKYSTKPLHPSPLEKDLFIGEKFIFVSFIGFVTLPGVAQSASVWQEQSSGWVDVTSFKGSKWRLQVMVWSCELVKLDSSVIKRNVRIVKLTFSPKAV